MTETQQLTRDMLGRLAKFWRESYPKVPMSDALLDERVFGPPDAEPENTLCVLDSDGELIALTLLVPPAPGRDPDELPGGIRWLGVHPDYRDRGLGVQLLEYSLEKLENLGATVVDFLTTPPFYILPGVNIQDIRLISWLMMQDFEHSGTVCNMTVDLDAARAPDNLPDLDKIWHGYKIRRATPEDRDAFEAFVEREWNADWAMEAAQGFEHDPISLFLATHPVSFTTAQRGWPIPSKTEEIVGFAVYEANQCLGSFGPTGVSHYHRSHGLGVRLLWATLDEMKRLGREKIEIGWVGPVDFYHVACGATLGPVFWKMRRRLRHNLRGGAQLPPRHRSGG